jgi:Tol biopolymer transport system component
VRWLGLRLGVAAAAMAAALGATAASAAVHREVISVTSSGAVGNEESGGGPMSADGRYVAFISDASDLVRGDTNGWSDAFVRDRLLGDTERVSLTRSGGQAERGAFGVAISADGRYCLIGSASPDMGGFRRARDRLYLRDRLRHTTRLVSATAAGQAANSDVFSYAISADGRFAAFMSSANNLVPGDTNDDTNGGYGYDIFRKNLRTGAISRVSVSSSGEQANGPSFDVSISADGRFVAFSSDASNLVPNDTNRASDLFLRDRKTHTTRRITVTSSGAQTDGSDGVPTVSPGGRYVTYSSRASNLVFGAGQKDVYDYQVYVWDRLTGETRLVSASPTGRYANDTSSLGASITATGVIVYDTYATNLTPGVEPGDTSILAYDIATQKTRLLLNQFDQSNGISADGRWLAVTAEDPKLRPDDVITGNYTTDVFVYGPYG